MVNKNDNTMTLVNHYASLLGTPGADGIAPYVQKKSKHRNAKLTKYRKKNRK